jgi:hypothetical protein
LPFVSGILKKNKFYNIEILIKISEFLNILLKIKSKVK